MLPARIRRVVRLLSLGGPYPLNVKHTANCPCRRFAWRRSVHVTWWCPWVSAHSIAGLVHSCMLKHGIGFLYFSHGAKVPYHSLSSPLLVKHLIRRSAAFPMPPPIFSSVSRASYTFIYCLCPRPWMAAWRWLLPSSSLSPGG